MDDKSPRTTSSLPSSSHPKTQSKTSSQQEIPSKVPPSERTGAAIMNSDDPSTADLRAWAEDKLKHYFRIMSRGLTNDLPLRYYPQGPQKAPKGDAPGPQETSQDGSIAVNNATMNSMAWGGPWIVTRKRDTLRPSAERVSHGEARYMGPAGGEGEGSKEAESPKKKKKRHRLSGLSRARGKSVEAGDGNDNIIR